MVIYTLERNKGIKGLRVIKITKYVAIFVVCVAIAAPTIARLTGSLSEDAIKKRLEPMGEVIIQGMDPNAPAVTSSGVGGPKDIYAKNCQMCHQTGVAGAPKFGNKADWAPRIAQGMDVLFKAAWTGIRAMPPKGNCLQCTQEDIQKTVQYMVDAAK